MGVHPSIEGERDFLAQKPPGTPAASAEQQVNICVLGNHFPTVSPSRFQDNSFPHPYCDRQELTSDVMVKIWQISIFRFRNNHFYSLPTVGPFHRSGTLFLLHLCLDCCAHRPMISLNEGLVVCILFHHRSLVNKLMMCQINSLLGVKSPTLGLFRFKLLLSPFSLASQGCSSMYLRYTKNCCVARPRAGLKPM